MKQDEAEKLARNLRPDDEYAPGSVVSVTADRLRQLCDHILSGDMRREIERRDWQIDRLRVALANLLDCSERYIFSTECQSERDTARGALAATEPHR